MTWGFLEMDPGELLIRILESGVASLGTYLMVMLMLALLHLLFFMRGQKLLIFSFQFTQIKAHLLSAKSYLSTTPTQPPSIVISGQ